MKKHIKNFNELHENVTINESDELGVVNIHIDGNGWIKNTVTNDIIKLLNNYQGERHIFVDGNEVNPYKRTGGMG